MRILFGGIVGRRFGADDGARAIGADADADVGFAWSGGGAGAGAGGGQGGTGSSATIAKFCSTDSGGALPRSLSAPAAAARKDQRNLAAYTMHSALMRARIIGKQGGLLTNRPGSSFSTKSPVPTNGYL